MAASDQDFVPGLNDPSPVSRVLILGFYDGATDGVLQIGEGGPVYRFDWTDSSSEQDLERHYTLRRLPPDSLDRLSAIIGEHIEPKWPAWLPIWKFPSELVKADVEQRTDAVLDLAGEPAWRIVTADTLQFGTAVAEPVRAVARSV